MELPTPMTVTRGAFSEARLHDPEAGVQSGAK